MHRNRFKKVSTSRTPLGIGRSLLPQVGPFASQPTTTSASRSSVTYFSGTYDSAPGDLLNPERFNHVEIRSTANVWQQTSCAWFLWCNTISVQGTIICTGWGGGDGTDNGSGGNGASGGGSGESDTDGADGGTVGSDGNGSTPGIGLANSVGWLSTLYLYDIGNGGAGGNGAASADYNGGAGGSGSRGMGGGGGGGAGAMGDPNHGSGGAGGGGCLLIVCNEIVFGPISSMSAAGGESYADTVDLGGGGSGGGGVIYVASRRKVGAPVESNVSAGKANSGSGFTGDTGTDGMVSFFAILPNNTLVSKTYLDQWDYL